MEYTVTVRFVSDNPDTVVDMVNTFETISAYMVDNVVISTKSEDE